MESNKYPVTRKILSILKIHAQIVKMESKENPVSAAMPPVVEIPEVVEIPKPEVQVSTPGFKNPASPYTALSGSIKEGVGGGQKRIRFFGPRFLAIWVMPIAITGILMEFLFISPLRNINPFS